MDSSRSSLVVVALLGFALAASGCAKSVPITLREVGELASPAGPGSVEPFLAVSPEGMLFLSWLEPRAEGGHRLRVAGFERGKWSEPRTIAEGDSFVVNAADTPSILALGGERLAASWPWSHGSEGEAYDVRVAMSRDGGRNWSAPAIPHRDGTAAEHGFVSLLPEDRGVRVIWLDGRNAAAEHAIAGTKEGPDHAAGSDSELRTAVLDDEGRMGEETVLDPRVCDCCPTNAVRTASGSLIAYRDRSHEEIRDIAVMRLGAAGSTGSAPAPAVVPRADGWKIAGCPVNGPALDADGDRVGMAWYTAPKGSARVLAAFSKDGGRSFGPPVPIDGEAALGHVDVELLDDGSAWIVWLASRDRQGSIQARRALPSGSADEPITLARTETSRASGTPRVARAGDRVYFAWTETATRRGIRLVSARMGRGSSAR